MTIDYFVEAVALSAYPRDTDDLLPPCSVFLGLLTQSE